VSDNTSMFIRHTGETSVAYIKAMWPVNCIGATELTDQDGSQGTCCVVTKWFSMDTNELGDLQTKSAVHLVLAAAAALTF
jgi:hypothetical protein